MDDMELTRGGMCEKTYYDYKYGKISEEECEEYLSTQSENFCIGAYCYSKYFYLRQDLSNAVKYVDKAIFLLEVPLSHANSDEFPLNSDDILSHKNISKIYMYAGQICAEFGDYDKSLLYYQRSQYHASQLNSGLDEIKRGIVYSFRCANKYSYSDLIANSITVVHPSMMNDPFDSLFTFWASEENLKKVCNKKEHIPMLSESFKSYRIRSFVGNDELTSDDRIVNNIIMWSHYANDHKGYCIRYKLSNYFIKKPSNKEYTHHYLRKMRYVPKDEKTCVELGSMNTTELFTTKSDQWSGESEIRLVSYDSSHKGDFLQLKLDECSSIDAIYFGFKCSDSDQGDIMSILGDKVKYYKMSFNPQDAYSMNIDEVSYNPSNEPLSNTTVINCGYELKGM